MSQIKSLVEHKEVLKKKTPIFVRQGARNIKRLPLNWRKPKGFQSKMRRYKKGKPKRATVGYKTPKLLQGMLKSGLREKKVSNLSELRSVNKESELAVLSSTLGKRKALTLIAKAKKLGIKFSNIKAEEYEKSVTNFLASRKKTKAVKKKKAEKGGKSKAGKETPEKTEIKKEKTTSKPKNTGSISKSSSKKPESGGKNKK